MTKIDTYIKKSGDDPIAVRKMILRYLHGGDLEGMYMCEGSDWFMLARRDGYNLIIDMAYGNWLKDIRPAAREIAARIGCIAIRFVSSRRGMERRAESLRESDECDVRLIAHVYEERM